MTWDATSASVDAACGCVDDSTMCRAARSSDSIAAGCSCFAVERVRTTGAVLDCYDSAGGSADPAGVRSWRAARRRGSTACPSSCRTSHVIVRSRSTTTSAGSVAAKESVKASPPFPLIVTSMRCMVTVLLPRLGGLRGGGPRARRDERWERVVAVARHVGQRRRLQHFSVERNVRRSELDDANDRIDVGDAQLLTTHELLFLVDRKPVEPVERESQLRLLALVQRAADLQSPPVRVCLERSFGIHGSLLG